MHKINVSKWLITFITLLTVFQSSAQQSPTWKLEFHKSFDWYKLASVGIFIVSSSEGLYGIDPSTGDIKWTLENFKSLPAEAYTILNKTPYIETIGFDPVEGKQGILGSLVKNSNGNMPGKSGRSILIDPLNGTILFDSKNAGFDKYTKREYLPAINSFLLEGQSSKERSFGLYDIASQKTLWIKEKPVKLKGITFRDVMKCAADPDGNLILRYVNNTYRINAKTGDYIWQRPTDSLYSFAFTDSRDYFFASGGSFIAKVDLNTGNIIQRIVPKGFETKENNSEAFVNNLFKNGITIQPFDNMLMASYSSSFNLYDYNSLSPKWIDKPKLDAGSVYNVIKNEKGDYLVFSKILRNSITLVHPDGTIAWSAPYTINGTAIKMLEVVKDGIICVTNTTADFISMDNGKSKIGNPLHYKPEQNFMMAHAKDNNSVGFFVGDKMYDLNYRTYTVKEILSDVKFRGADAIDKIPNFFEARKNGYFLSSPQNFMLVKYDGTVAYNKFYKRPGLSDKAKQLLLFGAGLSAGYVFNDKAQQYTNQLYYQGRMTTDDFIGVKTYDYYGGIGSALMAGGGTVEAFYREGVRVQNLKVGRPFHLVLAKLETGGTGFLKIDKETGDELSSIRLDDKEPTMEIDDAISGLYYFPNGKNLVFYSLANN